MRNIFGLFVLSALLILAVSGCKKSEEFINPVHKCGCGSMNWAGESFELLSAEYIQTSETNPLSRRYYITASIKGENEIEPHNINFTFLTDTVTNSVFFIPGLDSYHLVEEVNFNDELDQIREYQGVEGVVTIDPNVLGGTEKVNFNFNLKEYYNGALVGFDVPFSGSFSVKTNPL